MATNELTAAEREAIIEEGRQAALRKDDPISSPYLNDPNDSRLAAWMEGYRMGQRSLPQL
ncbi:hypothetical protein SAMN03159496_06186 [Rhizobium sp. NFR07]|uniref:hypothetical protein n=1 Tax=Rhizobium sp. NFR07 TaxID=1566262 RepID=UPI0008DF6633|nr:hypothetical protein [Rhizobium sp. NFR07]SFB63149.1 hypothetical protein SAMN03159496_06186 [Rhizobium sp. NFR07]